MMKSKTLIMTVVGIFISYSLMVSCSKIEESNVPEKITFAEIRLTGTMKAELIAPPNVPPPIGDREAKRVVVMMEILEKEGEMTDGVKYMYWTFGGSVPGGFIRTRIGDLVEFRLKNHPNNKLPLDHGANVLSKNSPDSNKEFVWVLQAKFGRAILLRSYPVCRSDLPVWVYCHPVYRD